MCTVLGRNAYLLFYFFIHIYSLVGIGVNFTKFSLKLRRIFRLLVPTMNRSHV